MTTTTTTERNFFDEAKAVRGKAIECTAEHFDYCLNVLPPIYGPGFFGISEPYSHETHDGKTVATRHWFAQVGRRFFCAFGIKADAVAAFGAL